MWSMTLKIVDLDGIHESIYRSRGGHPTMINAPVNTTSSSWHVGVRRRVYTPGTSIYDIECQRLNA